jgi:hypothetical protein
MSRCGGSHEWECGAGTTLLTRSARMDRTSVVVGMSAVLTGPVQMAQAAPKRFDFLLVSDLLPLGQLQGLQHFIHLFQGAAEGLNDMVDLLDGLLDSHW